MRMLRHRGDTQPSRSATRVTHNIVSFTCFNFLNPWSSMTTTYNICFSRQNLRAMAWRASQPFNSTTQDIMKDRRFRSSPLLRTLLVLVSLSVIERKLSTVAANQLFGSERNHQQQSRNHSIPPPPPRPEWQITGRGGADLPANDNDNHESSPNDTPKQEQESPSPPITPRPNGGGKKTFLPNFRLGEGGRRLLPKTIQQNAKNLQQHLKHGAAVLKEGSAHAGPSVVTAFTLLYTCEKGVSLATLYALALLGASCGFYLFLYFITIGYAVGITLPLAVALYVYNVSFVDWSFVAGSGLSDPPCNLVVWEFVLHSYLSWLCNHSAETSHYFTTDLSAFFADYFVGSSNPCLLSVERVHQLACFASEGRRASVQNGHSLCFQTIVLVGILLLLFGHDYSMLESTTRSYETVGTGRIYGNILSNVRITFGKYRRSAKKRIQAPISAFMV